MTDDEALREAMQELISVRDQATHVRLLNALNDAIVDVAPRTSDGGGVLLYNRDILAALVDALVIYAAGSSACATQAGQFEFSTVVGASILEKLPPAREIIERDGVGVLMERPGGTA